jgi:hypothetical protein
MDILDDELKDTMEKIYKVVNPRDKFKQMTQLLCKPSILCKAGVDYIKASHEAQKAWSEHKKQVSGR